MKRVVWGLAIATCVFLAGCTGEGTVSFEGTAISGPVAGDFTLFDQDGNSVNLSDFEGDVVVIMFIFTRCPDVCPVTTQNLAAVADELGENQMSGVTFLSVSVDPEYDTPARLKSFTQKHGVDWPHLTGSIEESQKVWTNFGIVVEKAFIEAHVAMDEMNHVIIHYPDNSSAILAMMYDSLEGVGDAWNLTQATLSQDNISLNSTVDENGIHIVETIDSVAALDNRTWSLFVWNSSSAAWQLDSAGAGNLNINATTNIAWAMNDTDPSNIPSPLNNSSNQEEGVCNGHGSTMGSGNNTHCMCDEGYTWDGDDKLSCVAETPETIGEGNYSVGHSTVMYILDKGQHKRVIWTGDSWIPSKVANDIEILLDE